MNIQRLPVMALIVTAVTLSGCTLTPSAKHWVETTKAKITKKEVAIEQDEPQPMLKKSVTDKPQRTSRELSLAWDNMGRAGAAIHQPDYVHVLHGRVNGHQSQNSEFGLGQGNRNHATQGKEYGSNQLAKGQGYSFYELQRWERYCDNGKGMDEPDWKFVSTERYRAPLSNCRPPTHDYAGYLESWKRFCSHSSQYDRRDIQIVKNSVRPAQLAGSCPRL